MALARNLLIALCLAMTIFHIADAESAAIIRVEPANAVVEPGFTKTLSLTCMTYAFGYPGSSQSIVSIIFSKSESNDTGFRDIVTLSSHPEGDQIRDIDLGSATARGNLSGYYPFLEVVWSPPSTQNSGVYQCAIYSLDNSGRPKVNTESVEVRSSLPDTSDLIDKVLRLQQTYDNLATRFEELENVANDTYQLPNFSRISSVYQNRRYYLSNNYNTYSGVSDAEVACELEGGYLAEIDDSDEFNFIKNFLDHPRLYYDVVVGATNEYTGGEWVHIFSNRTMSYTNWASSGTGYSASVGCVALGMRSQRQFRTTGCGREYDTLSLCEVPR